MPGSPVVMCHQSNETGAAAAAEADGCGGGRRGRRGRVPTERPRTGRSSRCCPNRQRPPRPSSPGLRTCASALTRVTSSCARGPRTPSSRPAGAPPVVRVAAGSVSGWSRLLASSVAVESFGPVPDRFRREPYASPESAVKPRPARGSNRHPPAERGPRMGLSPTETFGMLSHVVISSAQTSSRRTAGHRDDRGRRGAGGGVGADRVEGDQRPGGRVGGNAPARRGGDPGARLPAAGELVAPRAAAGGHFPRTRKRVGAGDRPGRRAGRGPAPAGGRPVRDAGPPATRAAAGSRASWRVARPA